MPLKSVNQKSWLKGLVAVSNRFSLPKGAIPYLVNFLLNERGALQVADGSAQLSIINSVPGPIVASGQYTDPTTGVTTKLALVYDTGTGNLALYNISTNPATAIANASGANEVVNTAGWKNPQIIEFDGKLIISAGNNAKPRLLSSLTDTQHDFANSSIWQAHHLYYYGDVIIDQFALNAYICYGQFNAVQIQLGGGSELVTPGPMGPQGQPAGISGAVQPTFNQGQGELTPDNVLVWQTLGFLAHASNQAPRAARVLINHAGALWAWNTNPSLTSDGLDGPSVLRQSSLNNPNSWPQLNVDYLAPDDGDFGTGAGVFTIAESGIAPNASLVLFKNFSGYQVTGLFQTPNFAIQKTKSDMGCIADRTVQFATGYGIFRLCHLGVALFDGVSDTLVSEEIRFYIFGFPGAGTTGPSAGIDFTNVLNCRAALCTSPPMYILGIPLTAGDTNYFGIAGGDGSLIRLLCYDLVMKAWVVLDIPFKITSIDQIRVPGNPAPEPLTHAGGFTDGVIRQLQNHDTTWDNGSGLTPPVLTPVALQAQAEFPTVGEPTARNYFHRINVRLHAPSVPDIAILPILDAQSPPTPAQGDAASAQPSSSGIYGTNVLQTSKYETESDFVATTPVAQTASTLRARVSVTDKCTIEGIEVEVVPKPPRAAGVQL